ncbi:universal stress protein [Streptomyces cinnabarinus]|uniref:Universal stress protein n=1 Tax=Streptomyces cinnabarinus TaxID=67287 RepID=A0ABY7K4S0_9ACTN|nr:universal stress protein [Streptomyces cinnabarinus]WAZ19498.1 universal stress protein [Streptomyces cinnabarinus]
MEELPLVAGVDGSPGSLQAVDWAVDEARRHSRELRLVHASLWERYEGVVSSDDPDRPSEQTAAEEVVATAVERARRRDPGVRVSSDVIPDEATHVLLGEAHRAFAVVTGARGRGGLAGLLLGSVALTVAARAHGPVIVVRGDKAGLAGTHERILLGAADPEIAREATRFAFREAEARGCVLDVVRAWRRPARPAAEDHDERASALLDALVHEATADHPDVRVRSATVEGPARTVLLDRSAAADLVIIGTRQRSGRFGLQFGRVGHTLLHHAHCPVAVVPQLE